MKSDEIYNNWKAQRNQVGPCHEFTEKVMNQVFQYEHKRRKPLFDIQRFIALISAHPLAKAGLIATGGIAGLVRAAAMIRIVLFGN